MIWYWICSFGVGLINNIEGIRNFDVTANIGYELIKHVAYYVPLDIALRNILILIVLYIPLAIIRVVIDLL
ncbi:MAG: hypothetical protein RR623_08255 [Bacilli bacterium]